VRRRQRERKRERKKRKDKREEKEGEEEKERNVEIFSFNILHEHISAVPLRLFDCLF